MAFTPSSSLAPSSVTVVGTVSADVTDRAARLLGHVTVDNAVAISSLPLPDGAASEETLAGVNEAINDVALTAILQRERIEP